MKSLKIIFLGIIILIVLIVGSSYVTAEKVIQSFTGTQGLQISYPVNNYYDYGKQFTLNYHVYNISGYRLSNLTTNCSLHIYHPNGSHAIEIDNLYYDGDEYLYNVNPTLLNGKGVYSYIVECINIHNIGGYVSGDLYITSNGESPVENQANLLGISISLILISFVLLYFAFKIDNSFILLKLLTIIFSMITLILVPSTFIIDAYVIKIQMYKLMTWYFRLFCTYMFIHIIYFYFKDAEKIIQLKEKIKTKMGYNK